MPTAQPFHLLVILSPHGYGHAAMTAPVVNALCRAHPQIRLSIRTTLPEWFLRSKYHTEFTIIPEACDFGFAMHNAFRVDVEASLAKYREFHRNWPDRVCAEQQRLTALAPDLVLSNVAYLPIAAARRAGIPAIGLCCLNWADLFSHFMGKQAGAAEIEQQIRAAYLDCTAFICPQPTMPMAWLKPHIVGPLGIRGQDCREQILQRLSLAPDARLVLVSLGGIDTQLDVSRWPRIDNTHYLLPSTAETTRPDCHPFDDLKIAFTDLIASCDAFITKPGYGAFSDAALNGTPVLYIERDDWPEQHYLAHWLAQQILQAGLSQQTLAAGDFQNELIALLSSGPRKINTAPGIDETLEILNAYL